LEEEEEEEERGLHRGKDVLKGRRIGVIVEYLRELVAYDMRMHVKAGVSRKWMEAFD